MHGTVQEKEGQRVLYLAFPKDLRDRFPGSVWLVYAKQIQETLFTKDDTVVLSEWVTDDRAELLQTLHLVQRQGPRIVYVGSDTETEAFKRQLCWLHVYDLLFFGNEISLQALEDLLAHPRSARDVARYLPESERTEMPPLVEATEEPKRKWRWPTRKEGPPVVVASPEKRMPSALWVVTGIWPRAGVSTVSEWLASAVAGAYTSGRVTLCEAPTKWPRMWERYRLDAVQSLEETPFGTVEGVVQKDALHLMPLPPGQASRDGPTKFVSVVLRHLRSGVVVVDGDTEELLDMADGVWCVLDCDPTYLSIPELGERYQALRERVGERLVTVLNQWTPDATYPSDVFEHPVRLSYRHPEAMQKALWQGTLAPPLPEAEALQLMDRGLKKQGD